ncbi:membrane-spanning 4-domains subfamily A member 10 [Antechinus flavipes]|uniref:membrane-spanning 4-domains subfamily A member 10 n=1 Tax=Antechinus flavipes TaxID=38775 RepID=UPI00223590B4|nr:membrane-spanning 4-domains subfamily A member 10 [Antechinus flavipes]
MAAAGENFYVVTGDSKGLVVPEDLLHQAETVLDQKPTLEIPHSGSPLRGTWKKSRPLIQLGALQIMNAFFHIFVGIYLTTAVKNLHLVAIKSWYPFWGGCLFFCSGTLLIIVGSLRKLKILTMTVSAIDCVCALCGIFVFLKDLVWECPFDFPIWRPYPTATVHLQRLEFGLLICTSLEFITLICAMYLLYRTNLSSEMMANFPMDIRPPEYPAEPTSPPPAYEEVIFENKTEKADP